MSRPSGKPVLVLKRIPYIDPIKLFEESICTMSTKLLCWSSIFLNTSGSDVHGSEKAHSPGSGVRPYLLVPISM